jgi:peptidoglycan/LPS O-acetylase OafA/YrhL
MGSISLLSFYTRRARRLVPELVLLLVAYLAIDAAKGHDGVKTVALAGPYLGKRRPSLQRR